MNTFWIDTGTTTLNDADRLLTSLASGLGLSEDAFCCTHLVRGDRPRVVLSFTVASAEPARRLAADGYEVTAGTPDEAGRAVLFPGASSLTGTLTVGKLLRTSAIDRVTVLGSAGEPAPDQPLMTRDHIRPVRQAGELVLTAMPAAGGVLVPFEEPNPTPCCADH
ncbi:hypothetical protein ACWEF9_29000 [Streptomyces sp. NPDC004980]